jgi:hypothetical protein
LNNRFEDHHDHIKMANDVISCSNESTKTRCADIQFDLIEFLFAHISSEFVLKLRLVLRHINNNNFIELQILW